MVRETPVCPVCDSSDWSDREHSVQYNYKGREFTLDSIAYGRCNVCGFEAVLPRHKKHNDPRIRDAHRKIDGLLTSSQIKAIRNKYGWSQQAVARYIRCGVNTFSKYERGEVTQSRSMDTLLRLLNASPDAGEALAGNDDGDVIEAPLDYAA